MTYIRPYSWIKNGKNTIVSNKLDDSLNSLTKERYSPSDMHKEKLMTTILMIINISEYQRPNLKNFSRGLNLRRGSNMFKSS